MVIKKIVLEKITHKEGIHIPKFILEKTIEHIQSYGKQNQEALLFWAGVEVGGFIFVTTCICPEALSITVTSNPCSLCPRDPKFIQTVPLPLIKLDAVAGAKVISEARKRGLHIIAQIHSHPDAAFHSSIDETYAFDTSEGFLSIVVPEFGSHVMASLSKCAIYRCEADEKFHRLTTEEIENTFIILDSEVYLE